MSHQSISNYFAAANKHDVSGMLTSFAQGASILDEGRERSGLPEIEQWMNETLADSDITMEILGIQDKPASTEVTARLFGTFPGSPADLCFAFKVLGGKISRLEITYAEA